MATGIVSAKVAALTEGVLTAMLLSKLKVATLVLLIAVATVVSTGSVIFWNCSRVGSIAS